MRGGLISFSGLPGVGKSSVARLLAQRIKAVWLRIDSLEQALVRSGVVDRDGLGPAGYYVGYALALDNLRLGLTVLAGAELLEVEFVCSDARAHRARVEARLCEVPGLLLPDWRAVREREYEVWERAPLVLDTAVLSPCGL